MLNEPASSVNDRPVSRGPTRHVLSRDDSELNALRDTVGRVLFIEREKFPDGAWDMRDQQNDMLIAHANSQLIASFEGRLLLPSETAYDMLDDLLAADDRFALFREENGQHVVHVIAGRINPPPRSWVPNLILFLVTVFSVLLVGTDIALNQLAGQDLAQARAVAAGGFAEIWRGWPYALSILLILGAHELGHYFAARRHKLAVTLPYFIPLPFLSMFGTLGAFIQLRQPMRNRKMLMDIGAAGPLAGLVFAIPILLIGLSNTALSPTSSLGGVYEGDSIIYAMAKTMTYGRFVPDGRFDVCVNCNQLTYAGWTGLLVTALNLFPLGQLDGGHIMYAAIGERARKLYMPFMALMLMLTLLVSETWMIWLIMLLLLGRVYAAPLDNITPLDPKRRYLAVFSLVVFVLIFVPAPMTSTAGGGLLRGAVALALPAALFKGFCHLRAWRR